MFSAPQERVTILQIKFFGCSATLFASGHSTRDLIISNFLLLTLPKGIDVYSDDFGNFRYLVIFLGDVHGNFFIVLV